MQIKGRCFIVGCPRSGTTLLQSLLASHTSVASFPESHFFCNLFGDYEPKRRLLGIASRRIYPRIKEFIKEAGIKNDVAYLPNNLIFTFQYAKCFVNLLDRLAIESNKTIWIEKTPPHLHYIDYIERNVPGAKFIHIVRNGADVITSIYELRNKYPEVWDGENRSLEKCVDRWINDIKITQKYLAEPNHCLVKYGDLVSDVKPILKDMCQFMDISFENKMLTSYSEQATRVSLKRETWKQSVGDEIKNRHNYKFKRLLTSEQQDYVSTRLNEWNLDQLFPYADSLNA